MHLAHLGIAVTLVGITMVKGYEATADVRMKPGDTVRLAGHAFRMDGMGEVDGPNYVAARARFTVTDPGGAAFAMRPEKRMYRSQRMPMTEAAIRSGLVGDIYVSLGEALSDGQWVVRAQVKPFVNWIWGGCVLMALGGLVSLTDRRYRIRARSAAAIPAMAATTAGD